MTGRLRSTHPSAPRWRVVIAWAAAFGVHGMLLMLIQQLPWLPSKPLQRHHGDALQVRLIAPSPRAVEPVDNAPASSTLLPAMDRAVDAKPATGRAGGTPTAETASVAATRVNALPESVPPPTSATVAATLLGEALRSDAPRKPRLLAIDGRPYLPDVDVAAAAAAARFPDKPRKPAAGARDPFSHRSTVPYVATKFDRYWVPDGETLVDTLLRKATKKATGVVGGIQFECQWILVVAGCSWGAMQRVTIDELKAMRADVPMPRRTVTQ